LTASNGQPAAFLAGGEFPVPIASNTTNGFPTTTVEFKPFGVALDVTPTIIDPEHLVLKIRSQVSELSTAGAIIINDTQIPSLTVRRAETTVELGSGQSFVLGGLLQNRVLQDISKIPWLGDVPVLGQLFRSERFKRNETELVIIVTPYLVQPSRQQLATPADGFRAPHDLQRVIDAGVYRQGLPAPSATVAPPGAVSVGPIGFRLD
jgi:pilus assembly protein CpaC